MDERLAEIEKMLVEEYVRRLQPVRIGGVGLRR
jgi:hypothetical protein